MTKDSSSGSSGSGPQGPGGPRRLNDALLGGLKPRHGDRTGEWLKGLTGDAGLAEGAPGQAELQNGPRTPASPSAQRRTVTSWVDRLFDCFGAYEYEYNQTVTRPELKVQVSRPEFVQSAERDRATGEPIQIIRGRLHTPDWSLSIRALPDRIEGYIIPNNMAIRLTMNPGEFFRYLEIYVERRDDSVALSLSGQTVEWEDVPALAKELFGIIVRVARGEGEPTEPFSLVRKQPVKPAPSGHPAFISPPPHLVAQAPTLAAAETGVFEPAGRLSLVEAWNSMVKAIDGELDALAAAGSQAFANNDMTAAQKAMRRTERLQSMQADMASAFERWKASSSEE